MSNEGKRKSEDLLQPEKYLCLENANINELSIELLEMVFQHLPRRERVICKEVCARWYSILMESPLFHKDRHIYFKNCVINAYVEPMSTILDATKPYDIFTFDTIENDSELDIERTSELLRATKEINFRNTKHNAMLLRMLLEAPLLETLGFYERDYEEYDNIRIRLSLKTFVEKHPNIFFENVKTVNVSLDSKTTKDYSYEFLDPLNKMIPEHATINVHVNYKYHLSFYFDEQVQNWIQLISTKRIKLLMNKVELTFLQIEPDTIEKFFEIDVSFKKFQLVYNKSDKYDMDKLLDKVKADKIILSLEVAPKIPNNFHRISKVVLDRPIGENVSLKWLEKMKNLKELDIYSTFEMKSCAFGHEAIKLDTVEKIKFYRDILVNCQNCVNAFKKSFKNLKEINIFCHSSLLLDIKCWKKIEKLEMKVEEFDVLKDNNLQEFPVQSLRVLIMDNIDFHHMYTNEKITSSLKKLFPKLEKFVYNFKEY